MYGQERLARIWWVWICDSSRSASNGFRVVQTNRTILRRSVRTLKAAFHQWIRFAVVLIVHRMRPKHISRKWYFRRIRLFGTLDAFFWSLLSSDGISKKSAFLFCAIKLLVRLTNFGRNKLFRANSDKAVLEMQTLHWSVWLLDVFAALELYRRSV